MTSSHSEGLRTPRDKEPHRSRVSNVDACTQTCFEFAMFTRRFCRILSHPRDTRARVLGLPNVRRLPAPGVGVLRPCTSMRACARADTVLIVSRARNVFAHIAGAECRGTAPFSGTAAAIASRRRWLVSFDDRSATCADLRCDVMIRPPRYRGASLARMVPR